MRNEVYQTGLDMRPWICDLRRADTLNNHRDFREQSSFVDADHNEVAGVSPLPAPYTLNCNLQC